MHAEFSHERLKAFEVNLPAFHLDRDGVATIQDSVDLMLVWIPPEESLACALNLDSILRRVHAPYIIERRLGLRGDEEVSISKAGRKIII